MIARLMWPFIILQIATVAAIFLFLRSLLHRQLEAGMKRIQLLDQENLRKNSELNKGLQKVDNDYRVKMAEAERRAMDMTEAAKEEIKKMREEERGKARDEAKKIIAGAIQQKDSMLKEAERDVFVKGTELAVLILRRLFSEEELRELRGKVSREVVDFLAGSEEIKAALGKNKEIEVITAEPLDKEDEKRILKVIESSSSGNAKTNFKVDKNIVGGLLLKMGEQIVDASIAHRINKAAMGLREGE